MYKLSKFILHYNELLKDIYPQPVDEEHTSLTQEVINEYVNSLGCTSVLDVGCGEAFAQPMFEEIGISYVGVCLGNDYVVAKKLGRNVHHFDFNFLPFDDNSFDLVFSRHALEHSPFPLLTLMDWHRTSKKWLCLVLPNPDHWGYIGRNHYSVMGNKQQIRWLLRRSGWKLVSRKYTDTEYRYLCEKLPRISEEGWCKSPLSHEIYESDRQDTETWM